MTEATTRDGQKQDFPEWLPDEYDPDADLRERLPIMAEIDARIELWAADDRGLTEILGLPHRVEENGFGALTLYAGGTEFNWNYEAVVPANDTAPFVRSVDPDQDIEDYQRTKKTELEDIDVRIYGVDHDRLEGVDSDD